MGGSWPVTVDDDACVGHGQCFARAPQAYEADGDGFCVVRTEDVPASGVAPATAGADACPERAIALTAATI